MTPRRHLLLACGGLVAALGLPKAALADATTVAKPSAQQPAHKGSKLMTTATMKDGAKIYFKDWGAGPVVTFSHGWPLTADAWDAQMLFLGTTATALSRTIDAAMADRIRPGPATTWIPMPTIRHAARDARGQGCDDDRSFDRRRRGRALHRPPRHIAWSKAVLISAVPPHMVQTPTNPNSAPMSVFDGLRSSLAADRAGFFKELAMPFFGYNRPNAKVSQGQIESFWLQGMMGASKASITASKPSPRPISRMISRR